MWRGNGRPGSFGNRFREEASGMWFSGASNTHACRLIFSHLLYLSVCISLRSQGRARHSMMPGSRATHSQVTYRTQPTSCVL